MSTEKADTTIPLQHGAVLRLQAWNYSTAARAASLTLMTPSNGAQENVGYTPAESAHATLRLEHIDQLAAALSAARELVSPPPPAAAGLTASPSTEGAETAAAVVDPEDEVGALLVQYPYPGHHAVIDCIAVHMNVPEAAARQWLLEWAECNGVVL